jgi:hypothetical protein
VIEYVTDVIYLEYGNTFPTYNEYISRTFINCDDAHKYAEEQRKFSSENLYTVVESELEISVDSLRDIITQAEDANLI